VVFSVLGFPAMVCWTWVCGQYRATHNGEIRFRAGSTMLAEMLDLAQVTGVKQLEFSEGGRQYTATRELDIGFKTVQSKTPALITASE
jgi:hypothetical protein